MLVLAGVLLLAGLAADRTATVASSDPRTVSITIHFSRFDPAVVRAAPGEEIRFVIHNTDPIDHEFILGDDLVQRAHELGSAAAHSAPGQVSVPAGETVRTTVTFTTPGALTFACHLPGHFAYGMRGTVVVGQPSSTA
jgi:uncharacterized cupredoxin-like copper-binding protein